jgi:hypothetical protein
VAHRWGTSEASDCGQQRHTGARSSETRTASYGTTAGALTAVQAQGALDGRGRTRRGQALLTHLATKSRARLPQRAHRQAVFEESGRHTRRRGRRFSVEANSDGDRRRGVGKARSGTRLSLCGRSTRGRDWSRAEMQRRGRADAQLRRGSRSGGGFVLPVGKMLQVGRRCIWRGGGRTSERSRQGRRWCGTMRLHCRRQG